MKADPVTTITGAPGPNFSWHLSGKAKFTSWEKSRILLDVALIDYYLALLNTAM